MRETGKAFRLQQALELTLATIWPTVSKDWERHWMHGGGRGRERESQQMAVWRACGQKRCNRRAGVAAYGRAEGGA